MTADRAILMLIDRVAERIGYRPEAIPYASAVQALRARFPRGLSAEEIERRAEEGDAEVERALLESVSVGETFFFRQADQFQFVAETFAPQLTGKTVRAWSAGCATGEEAYSLAACLSASVPSGTQVEVLGTDVAERNVLAAVRGLYGPWSVREAGPILFPTFGPSELGSFSIAEPIRALTNFRTHNVLEEPPSPQSFDVIFCRNVLLYFSGEAAELACDRIVSALAPGGLVAFGTLDIGRTPADCEAVGPRGANLFVKSVPRTRTRAPRKLSMKPSLRPAARVGRGGPHDTTRLVMPESMAPPLIVDEGWLVDHLRALSAIEQNDFTRAQSLLDALCQRAPDYLPGLFELAVLSARRNHRSRAELLMRELLRKTEKRDPHDPVPGPEELTIAYYRVAAEAYLGFAPGEGKR